MTVQHVVLVEWKDGADQTTINAFMSAVEGLNGAIDGVENVQWGENFTDRAGNFTHAAIVTMRDKDVLSAYGPHPAHQAALDIAKPILANIMVADFEPK